MTPHKFFLFIIFFWITSHSFPQERQKAEFGKISQSEFDLKLYEKDTTAAAVVLYEQGYYYFGAVEDNIKLFKEVHRKIKIFDSKRFEQGNLDIPLFVSEETSEKVTRYNAWTHNGNIKTKVKPDAVFLTSVPEIGRVCRIIFPNIKDGSILEYFYRIESPFLFNFYGWEFQGELPKVYSEFLFKIPIDFQFNNVLYGNQSLYINKSEVIDDCLQTTYNAQIIRCPITLYAMKDIPAFQEEDYMLSPRNYIARVEFEPKELRTASGWSKAKKFSTTWKDVDKLLKKGEIGKQIKKTNYFNKNLPDSIISKADEFNKAKAIYKFIQNHYTWDGRYYSSETQVKDAFDLKKGSVPEINLSLINALEAGGLDANVVLVSTRQNGLPTELYPVLTKFNYTLVMLTIENETFLLDATNKKAPFGIIPFHTLNVQGRVMDFKKGSYWVPIEPYKKNVHYINAQVAVDNNGVFEGNVNQVSSGYIALEKRKNIEEKTLAQYKKTQEKTTAGIEINNYQLEALNLIDKPLKENYNISIEPELVGDKVILYPFFNKTYITENPFKMKERSYPMDFGFPFTNTYLVSVDLGDIYEIEQLPKNRTIKLPGEDGECSVTYVSEDNKINIRFNMKLNAYRFPTDAYQSLKEFFGTMIRILQEEPITLKKI